jgi:hypothetical protein
MPAPDADRDLRRWFLSADERGNPQTSLDSRHPDGLAWSTGNRVRALVHGSVYFAELHAAVEAMGSGDLLLFTDWRSDPDEPLSGPCSEVGALSACSTCGSDRSLCHGRRGMTSSSPSRVPQWATQRRCSGSGGTTRHR